MRLDVERALFSFSLQLTLLTVEQQRHYWSSSQGKFQPKQVAFLMLFFLGARQQVGGAIVGDVGHDLAPLSAVSTPGDCHLIDSFCPLFSDPAKDVRGGALLWLMRTKAFSVETNP